MAATQEFPFSNMTQAHKAVLVIALLSPATLTQELGICRRLTSRHVPLLAPSGAIFPLGHCVQQDGELGIGNPSYYALCPESGTLPESLLTWFAPLIIIIY